MTPEVSRYFGLVAVKYGTSFFSRPSLSFQLPGALVRGVVSLFFPCWLFVFWYSRFRERPCFWLVPSLWAGRRSRKNSPRLFRGVSFSPWFFSRLQSFGFLLLGGGLPDAFFALFFSALDISFRSPGPVLQLNPVFLPSWVMLSFTVVSRCVRYFDP